MRRRSPTPVLALLALTALAAAPGRAAGPTLYQHGGRATAQAGAFTARGATPVAVTYNPAAITRLDGLQFEVGFDFTAPRDDYSSRTGDFAADHIITLSPAVYATWHTPEDRYPFAFGLGFNSESWYFMDWEPALFPGRFLNRRQELSLWDAQAVIAYELDERWSVGAGVHYYFGTLGEGRNRVLPVAGQGGFVHSIEVARLAEADIDGLGFDLGFQFDGGTWGWGLVADSGAELEGTGEVKYAPRDVPADPVLQSNLAARFGTGTSRQSFELPWEVRTGFWAAPYPELRLELDVAYQAWSVIDTTVLEVQPNPFSATRREATVRDWHDTVSVRLGLEGDVADHWMVSAGLGWEPSPVPRQTLDPGFPRGDALVYAVGFSYVLPQVSIDVGYSFHDYGSTQATGQEPQNPRVNGSYETRNQVWALSGSWKW
ncbi:MAG TPA: outer membrane protein transport protein [Thermoanaerobaculia bacterium]|nr:outer membrane protein transport protein [Thermoanaerobaculia bacterium]